MNSIIKSFESDPKYDSYQRGLASIVYSIFDKKIEWKWYC